MSPYVQSLCSIYRLMMSAVLALSATLLLCAGLSLCDDARAFTVTVRLAPHAHHFLLSSSLASARLAAVSAIHGVSFFCHFQVTIPRRAGPVILKGERGREPRITFGAHSGKKKAGAQGSGGKEEETYNTYTSCTVAVSMIFLYHLPLFCVRKRDTAAITHLFSMIFCLSLGYMAMTEQSGFAADVQVA